MLDVVNLDLASKGLRHFDRHDCRCDDHRRAEFNQERKEAA